MVRSKHKWYLAVSRIERFRSNPDAPVWVCEHCGKQIDLRDAIDAGGWEAARSGVCPGVPLDKHLPFHMIRVVAPNG